MFSVSLFAQGTGQTESTKMLKKAVIADQMARVILVREEMETAKTLLTANLEAGNGDDAKKYAKSLLADYYSEPELYPLFEKVIDETIVQAINCETAKSQLIDLFTNVFPEMLNTVVVSSKKATDGTNIVLSELGLRQEALSSIANGMFTNMKKVCTETGQLAANEALTDTRRMMVMSTDAESEAKYTGLVCITMDDVFVENGLKKQITFVK